MTLTNTLADTLIANLLHVERDIEVGDLCVVIDYKGREVGARATHIMDDTIVGKVCGLDAPRPYRIGDQIARDRPDWRRAI